MVGIGDGALVGSSRPTGASVGPITGASVGAVGVGIAEGASESRDPGPDKDKKSNSSENDGATEGIGSSSFKSSSILGNGCSVHSAHMFRLSMHLSTTIIDLLRKHAPLRFSFVFLIGELATIHCQQIMQAADMLRRTSWSRFAFFLCSE
jgi:hypothetical protein